MTLEQIADTAIELFAERGFDGCSLKDVGAAVGVTQGTIYHHVRTKRGLYLAAFHRAVDVVYELYDSGSGAGDSLVGELQGVLENALRVMRERPALLQLLVRARTDLGQLGELGDEPPADLRRYMALMSGICSRAIDRGEITSEDTSRVIYLHATLLWGVCVVGLQDEAAAHEAVKAIDWALGGGLPSGRKRPARPRATTQRNRRSTR